MQVFIMRHGQAESLAGRDRNRRLTKVGVSEALRVGRWLTSQFPQPDFAWISPYQRTQQTFSALNSAFSLGDDQFRNEPQLVPHGNVELISQLIWDFAYEKPEGNLLIVSHMPVVAFLVEALDDVGNAPIFFPAAVAKVDLNVNDTSGRLDWIKAPHELP